jgi:hypothetical protein
MSTATEILTVTAANKYGDTEKFEIGDRVLLSNSRGFEESFYVDQITQDSDGGIWITVSRETENRRFESAEEYDVEPSDIRLA